MWENETVVLVTSLKKRLLVGTKKVGYKKIVSDNAIPPYIKSVFAKKVEEYIKTETPFTLAPTEHFDIQPGDLANIKSRLTDVLRESATFPASEVEEILRQSLVLRLDYIVKPADTMRRILFDVRNAVQTSEMDTALDPYKKLLPYADHLIKECNRLGYDRIESDEYSKIIVDMFHQLTNGETVPLILRDFNVLTDFLSEAKGEQVTRVDGDVLQEFLADRNLWNYRRALDIELKLGKADFDAVDLEMTMKRYLEMRAEFFESEKREAEKAPASGQEDEILDSVLEAPEAIQETPDVESGDESTEWDLESALEENPEQTEAPSEEIAREEPVKEEAENVPVSEMSEEESEAELEPDIEFEIEAPAVAESEKQPEPPAEKKETEEKKPAQKQMRIIRRDQKQDVEEEDVFESAAGEELRGLGSLIDERTEKIFVKKLFDGDRKSYSQLLAKLEDAESWRVAKILIDNELFKRDVDPFSREAIKLVDLVYSRYYPEEGVGGK